MESSGWRSDGACECLFLRASLEVESHGETDCVIIDLTSCGARVASADLPTVGDYGLLTIPTRYFMRTCKVVQRGQDDTFHLAFMPET
jgi:hypothetical protein